MAGVDRVRSEGNTGAHRADMVDDAAVEETLETNTGERRIRELTANVTLPQFRLDETVAGGTCRASEGSRELNPHSPVFV